MKKVISFIWQLPQNLLGLIIILILCGKKDRQGVWIVKPHIGVSLGDYIILHDGYEEITLQHESGHQKQSMIFGPLYLPIIGFASAVCCNLFDRIFHRNWLLCERHDWYYTRWPESWADNLGGVKRFVV